MIDLPEPLRASIARLRELVAELGADQLTADAYPTQWTVADVLSHLGSGAVIFDRRLRDAIDGKATPAEFPPSVWLEWEAKDAGTRAGDALVADRSTLDLLDALTPDQRARCVVELGPLALDYPAYVGLRLNEHVLHTWDIEVAVRPGTTLPPDATAVVIDNLDFIARYTAKPTGSTRTVIVRTTEPVRLFTVSISPESVTMTADTDSDTDSDTDTDTVTLPAEAFVRLVYGRLDPAHTPSTLTGSRHLDELRRVFPGP